MLLKKALYICDFNRFFDNINRKARKNLLESGKSLIFAPDRVHHRFSSEDVAYQGGTFFVYV